MRVFLLLLPLLACQRDQPLPPALPDPALLAGTYRKVSEWSGGQNLWCTYYHDTCALDNRYRFERGGSFVVEDAGLPCSAPEEAGGAWALEGRRLLLPGGVFEVDRFDGQDLQLSAIRNRNGFETRIVVHYRRE